MACFTCGTGNFVDVNWVTGGPDTTSNGITVGFLRTTGGVITGLRVSNGDYQAPPANVPGGRCQYYFWGGTPKKFLAFYTISAPLIDQIRRVISLIDLESELLTSEIIVDITLPSNMDVPFMQTCPGTTGGVVFAGTPVSQNHLNAGIYTAKGVRITSIMNYELMGAESIIARASSSTHFTINNAGTVIAAGDCIGESVFSAFNNRLNFNPVTVGSSSRENFAITNIGNNCLTINSIANVSPFRVIPSVSNRTLQAGEVLELEVEFSPSDNVPYSEEIKVKGPLAAQLINGDNTLVCTGQGMLPGFSIIGSFVFGKVPVLTSKIKTIKIKNTSDVSITYSGTASPIGSLFRWNGFGGTLGPGATSSDIQITFVSPEIPIEFPFSFPRKFEKSYSEMFSLIINDNTYDYTLHATSCRAQPKIVVEETFLDFGLSFGNVNSGVKKVMRVSVSNPGNAILNYSARIIPTSGNFRAQMDASIFGLQQRRALEDISAQILPDLQVKPDEPCGNIDSGTGKGIFYVSVKGMTFSGTAHALLEIFNHNVGDGSALDKYSIKLTAKILPSLST